MPAPTAKLPDGPALYLLLFVLGDISAIPTHGPNLVFWLFTVLAVGGGAAYAARKLPLLNALPRKI
jgi:hypothetical protein